MNVSERNRHIHHIYFQIKNQSYRTILACEGDRVPKQRAKTSGGGPARAPNPCLAMIPFMVWGESLRGGGTQKDVVPWNRLVGMGSTL